MLVIGWEKTMLDALYVEISSIGIILLVVILYTQRQSSGFSALQRQFNRLVYTNMIMLVIDACCWLVDGTTFPSARILNYALQTIYYTLHVLLPFFWALYVEAALSTDMNAVRRRLILASIPVALLIAFLPFNIRLGYVFTIDEYNVYHRSFGFLIYGFLTYALLIYASVRALIKAKGSAWIEDRRRCYTLAFFAVLPSLGGILQAFFYGLSLNWILSAVAILLIYIDAQNRQISADPMTGLNNRRELSKFLLRECRESQREDVLALIMIDIDGFKQVNDTYGHFYGDTVLLRVTNTLKLSCKGTQAFLGRYGGDEFCIVYPAGSEQAILDLIDQIDSNLERCNRNHREEKPVGLSLGYAIFDPDMGDNPDELIHRADQNMYRVKNAKKCA